MGFSIRLPRRKGKGGSAYFTFYPEDPIFIFINPIYFHKSKSAGLYKKEGRAIRKERPPKRAVHLDAEAFALLKAQIG